MSETATAVTSVGAVKWFDIEKGYGFIKNEAGGPDIFVHYTGIWGRDGDGFRNLSDGQRVSFQIRKTEKGLLAYNVQPLD